MREVLFAAKALYFSQPMTYTYLAFLDHEMLNIILVKPHAHWAIFINIWGWHTTSCIGSRYVFLACIALNCFTLFCLFEFFLPLCTNLIADNSSQQQQQPTTYTNTTTSSNISNSNNKLTSRSYCASWSNIIASARSLSSSVRSHNMSSFTLFTSIS